MANPNSQVPAEIKKEIANLIVSSLTELQSQLSQSSVGTRRINEVNNPAFLTTLKQYERYYIALTWEGLIPIFPSSQP